MKRFSHQREAIHEVLKGVKCHPSANWVYERVRQELPNISLGTVYRNLSELRDEGEIMGFIPADGTERFDANAEQHYHFCCLKCGSVIDIDMPVMSELNQKVRESTGLEAETHNLIFYGLCEKCQLN